MDYLKENSKFLNVLLLPVLLLIGHQSLQNKHMHFFQNETIVHSHPLQDDNENPIKNHHHSKAEILFFQIVSFDYYSHSGELYFEPGAITSPRNFITAEEQSQYIVWLYNTDARDPPAGQLQQAA